MVNASSHDESWLQLPWHANGMLPPAERAAVDEHLHACERCARELTVQRQLHTALSAPDRGSYAPGPSFRKLLARIDAGASAPRPAAAARSERRVVHARFSPWHAWAASVLLLVGGALATTAFLWSQPRYATHTLARTASSDVLHIAFVPSLSLAQAGEILRAAHARVVEGPGATGVVGVVSADGSTRRTLADRLHAEAAVRWIEPIADATPQPDAPGPSSEY